MQAWYWTLRKLPLLYNLGKFSQVFFLFPDYIVIWALATAWKTEKKKINSAPLLIKSAWSLWQNATREKQQLTLGF